MAYRDHLITTMDQLESLYGEKLPTSIIKEIDHISEGYRRLIEAAPFIAIATSGPEGLDCSPKGDAAGFVRILDDRTLAIPDRPGNNRIDGFRNIVRDPRIALLFLIPGIGETLRVNGRATISVDPELMQGFAVGGKLPRCCADRSYREYFLSLLEGHRTFQAVGRSDQDRSQEPAFDGHDHRRTKSRQTGRRDLRPRGAGAHQGAALLSEAASREFFAHVLRYGGGDGDRRLVFRNRNRHLTRMKMQWQAACARRASVDIVADDRPSHLGAMHAQLMRAPGQRLERKPAETGRRDPSLSRCLPRAGRAGRVSSTSRAPRRAWPAGYRCGLRPFLGRSRQPPNSICRPCPA